MSEYFNKAPFSDYVNGCGISKVGLKDPEASLAEKDDYCVTIYLRTDLPSGLAIAKEKGGVKIYARVAGPFVAY